MRNASIDLHTDRRHLITQAYADGANLAARADIYRYQTSAHRPRRVGAGAGELDRHRAGARHRLRPWNLSEDHPLRKSSVRSLQWRRPGRADQERGH